MMMMIDPMEQKILTEVRSLDNVTFAELGHKIEGFRGFGENLYEMNYGKLKNLIYWSGLSAAASMAVQNLLVRKQVVLKSTGVMVYAIDGEILKLPIAKKVRDYKTRHWLPVVLANP